jgi:hypothetical protein
MGDYLSNNYNKSSPRMIDLKNKQFSIFKVCRSVPRLFILATLGDILSLGVNCLFIVACPERYWYPPTCEGRCTPNCRVCDWLTGTICEKCVEYTMYGKQCDKVCGNCAFGCAIDEEGLCFNGAGPTCVEGFYGEKCDRPCPVNCVGVVGSIMGRVRCVRWVCGAACARSVAP